MDTFCFRILYRHISSSKPSRPSLPSPHDLPSAPRTSVSESRQQDVAHIQPTGTMPEKCKYESLQPRLDEIPANTAHYQPLHLYNNVYIKH